jgi:predicted enzyme related to lactoylglutathione lyase
MKRRRTKGGSRVGERNGFPAGTPCWVDVTTTDLEGTNAFYTTLFGWEASIDPRPEAGGYTTFRLRGKDVAAASRSSQPDAQTGWKTNIASDDVDTTAAKITEAGGSVLAEPFDVLDAGRMAFAGDPTGGVFGVWQAGMHKGAQLVNEPGTWNWSELATRDVATARSFYSAVFGWASEELTDVPGGYHVQTIDGHRVAGILPISPEMGDMPTGWGVYFSVEDADASTAKAQELGGTVIAEPFDVTVGRTAWLVDPLGTPFRVIKLAVVPD